MDKIDWSGLAPKASQEELAGMLHTTDRLRGYEPDGKATALAFWSEEVCDVYDPTEEGFGEKGKGDLWAIANNGSMDRDDEIILPSAWKKAIRWYVNAGCPMLFGHSHSGPVVANARDLQVKKQGLMFKPDFATDLSNGAFYWLSHYLEGMYLDGRMRAFSVGFYIDGRTSDPAEMKRLLEEVRGWGWDGKTLPEAVIYEAELVEISCVDVGSNREALTQYVEGSAAALGAVAKGLGLEVDDRKTIASFFGVPEGIIGKHSNYNNAQERDDAFWTERNQKTTVPFRSFPLAPENTPWSFPAAAGNQIIEFGGWKAYRDVHTWYDPTQDGDNMPPETRKAYKLAHHKQIGGSIKTVLRGVMAATAVLLGARGGANIPDGDRRAAYNHLAKHYKEFDKEPPEFKACEQTPEELLELWGLGERETDERETAEEREYLGRMRDAAEGLLIAFNDF